MQRYSHLISLETVVGYWELRRFQETQININGLLEKSHIHHISIVELLKWNLMSQVAELFADLFPLFLWVHRFSQKSPEIKLFYDLGRKYFHFLAGEA